MSRRSSILIAVALASACGGSTSTNTSLTGNIAFQAVAVSGYQAFRGQADYPYRALQLTLPTGSPFLRGPRASRRLASPGFEPELNLYSTEAIANGVATVSFFTDAAATVPAGSIVISGVQGALGQYAAFPATLQATVDITAGNLPCSGALTITIGDTVGKNELKGNLTLPKTGVGINFDFTLDDAGNVGGSSIIQEHGSTISMTGISGGLASGGITGNVTVSPSGWTGTGTFSLATGDFGVVLATGGGSSQANTDGQGGLALTFADGTAETVSQPLTTQPDAPISASDAGTGPVDAGAFTLATLDSHVFITGKSADGQFGGLVELDGGFVAPVYLAAGSTTPVQLQTGGGSIGSVYGINVHGAMAGYVNETPNGGVNGELPIYWASPTAAPTKLKLLAGDVSGHAVAINDSGQIVGDGTNAFFHHLVYYSSPTAAPVLLSTKGVPVDNNGNTDGHALGINNRGEIIGDYNYTVAPSSEIHYVAFAWATPASDPTPLALPAGDTDAEVEALNDNGELVGATSVNSFGGPLHAVYWASATAQAQVLPLSGSDVSAAATSINASGVIAGTSSSQNLLAQILRPGFQWIPAEGSLVEWSGANHLVSRVSDSTGFGCYIADSGKIADGNHLFTPK